MSTIVVLSIGAMLMFTHGTVANAASSVDETAPSESAPDNPATDDPTSSKPTPDNPDLLAHARELFAEGNRKFEFADCAGAIKTWEQAYEILPLSMRSQLQVPLANAHMCAYEADADPEHLRAAQTLFRDYLDALGADNEEVKAEVEPLLEHVEAELAHLKAEADQREQVIVEREAAAREEVAREVETKRAKAQAWTEKDQRRYRLFIGVGGGLAGLGVTSLGVMAAGLALGERVDKDGQQANLNPYTPDSTYADLLSRGTAFNRTAWATGVVGGALVLSGTALIVTAVITRKRKLKFADSLSRLQPRFGGFSLYF